MIDAMQPKGNEITAESLINAYKQEAGELQDKVAVLKAVSATKDRTLAAMAAQMEANQAEIARLADMVREAGGEPFPEIEGAADEG